MPLSFHFVPHALVPRGLRDCARNDGISPSPARGEGRFETSPYVTITLFGP
jgi:hypothetical protein